MSHSLLYDAFAHHTWATLRILDTCEPLTSEQLATPVPGTYGSIMDTLRHLVGADTWYLTFFRDDVTELDEKASAGFDELRSATTTTGDAWLALLEAGVDADTDIVEHGNGWEDHGPAGFRLAQVVHHGTDHRSQICTVLTTLGIEPPEIDVWAWGQAVGRTRTVDLRPAGSSA
jgi:uncharacterized damage-inducible protein DinB